MAHKKTKRIFPAVIVLWTLIGVYFFEYFGNRDLFLYITLLLLGIYVSKDIDSTLKVLWVCLLAWNVTDELGLILGHDLISYSFLLVPVFYAKRIKSLFRISLNKLFTIFAEH